MQKYYIFCSFGKLLLHRLKMSRIEWVLTAISNVLGTAKICLLYASGLLF